jgi:hypothetical protein
MEQEIFSINHRTQFPEMLAPMKAKHFLILAALLGGLVPEASSATYYVAPQGDNAQPGSFAQPWANPGFASRQLQPGDTLVIRAGRYILAQDDDVIRPVSGTSNAWIVIQGETGQRPALAGRDNLGMAVDLSGASHVRIENLEITHDDDLSWPALEFRVGIEITGQPASHIVLQDLYIHHLDESGLNIQDISDLQVINCQIDHCGVFGVGGPRGEQGGWRAVRLQGCTLSYHGHYYQGCPLSPADRPDGFGIEQSLGPIEIVDTISAHNLGDGLDSKAQNTTIRRCIVANNFGDGIKLWGTGSRVENTLIYGRGDGIPSPWAPLLVDCDQTNGTFEIVNVTIDDPNLNNYIAYAQYDKPVPITLTIRNCIFKGNVTDASTGVWVNESVRLIADHNLFFLPSIETVLLHGAQAYAATNLSDLGPGNFFGDPLFLAPAWGREADYHLQTNSPALNAGSQAGAPTDDLENVTRGLPPTLGAFEARKQGAHSADLLIKKETDPDSSYSLDQVYLPQPAGDQIADQKAAPGETVFCQIKLRNDRPIGQPFILQAIESPESGWEVHYFMGSTDISAQILGSAGYLTAPLAPDSTHTIRVSMKPAATVLGQTAKSTTVKAFIAQPDAVSEDAVMARTTCSTLTAYTAAFDFPAGPEWSVRSIEQAPNPDNGAWFLGRFRNQTLRLTLTNLSVHTDVTLDFHLYVIGSWSGNGPPETNLWDLRAAGGPVLLHTTFSNFDPSYGLGERRQAFPDSYPAGDYPARTGFDSTNSLGYVHTNAAGMSLGVMDCDYHLTFTFAHTTGTLTLEFAASGLAESSDATWGLNTVCVWLANHGALLSVPSLAARRMDTNIILSWPVSGAGFRLETTDGFAGSSTWTPATNVPVVIDNQNVVSDPISGARRFYRLRNF